MNPSHACIHEDLLRIAGEFRPIGSISEIREFGNGNINSTYLVVSRSSGTDRFILQRINTHVFPKPELVMKNIRAFTSHAALKLRESPLPNGRRWVVPLIIQTGSGQDGFRDTDGSFWRAISFIEHATSHDTLKTFAHARETGIALGIFHSLISDLPCSELSDTLEGFHVTPRYLAQFDEAVASMRPAASAELSHAFRCIEKRRGSVGVLEQAKASGKLPLRPIHGDPKVNNIMLDEASGRAVSMIDLDTVKPGLVQYDIGDCLRSGCNPLGEETSDWERVRFDPDMAREILHGYLGEARTFLTQEDFSFMYEGIRLIAFELGLRFITDHIQGDRYFKAGFRGHNLQRALVQFRLCESIEEHAAELRAIAKDLV
ncbi:MAG TPA: aminoglycoside phosphotransferase family protein [Candidatus Ozemobacteraceae bacterium]|nr:aminoglycoside phosphotransferase family protein [Candidatus Ozemobacteraceae bacterium]